MREALEKITSGFFGGVVRGVLDAVFPAVCVGCGKEGRYVCQRCEGFTGEVAPICPICQQGSFTGERHQQCGGRYALDGYVSCWEYEGVVKMLLHDIKYRGVTHAAKETAQRASFLMLHEVPRFQPFLLFLSESDTFLTYVPMHKRKERFRGFNQAALFARELSFIAKRPVIPTLEKLSDTRAQVDLKKEDRLLNARDAFTRHLRQDFIGVRNVVLVDDVWTTGATMKECCKVLKQAGVEKVWGFTIARTP